MGSVQQREELHKTIWAMADELRGAIGGWEFKAYVLGTLFYRFISENLTDYINRLQEEGGVSGFNYADMPDEQAEAARNQMVQEKGFFILPSQLFCNVCKNCEQDVNLNMTLSDIFSSIEASAIGTPSEDDLKGLFSDFNVDSSQLGGDVKTRNKLIAKVLKRIEEMNLGDAFSDNKIDAFGDAYEFLMTMYASSAGKSGGEFFTPQEVSELLARITAADGHDIRSVYDPACGSGSLLLKFSKTIGKENPALKYYGQEINPTTYNLCRINMFLHNINYDNFDIQLGDTLISPKHREEEPFDAIVSNPPYSISWEGSKNPILINDDRFADAGVLAPDDKADLAFTLHMLKSLSESGTAAIVEYPGVLHRKGKEQAIRKWLVENNFVDTIIQLPENLFFGVPIATCIIVLKKGAKKDNMIMFIDASKEFVKDGNKNKLTSDNQDKIYDVFCRRENIQYFAQLISNDTVLKNDAELSVGAYVESESKEKFINIDEVDKSIDSILKQEIDLNKEIEVITQKIKEMMGKNCKTWISLENVLDYLQPGPYIVKSTEYDDDYETPVLTAGQSFVLGYTDEKDGIFNASSDSPTIIFDDFTTSFHWVDFPFKVKSSAMKMLIPKKDVNLRYVYFAMQQIKFIPKQHQRHWISKYSKFVIPYPTSAEQKEIVEMLDKFNLASKALQKLINLRELQFNYYRDLLFTFE